MSTRPTPNDFAALVQAMRAAQRLYFRTRTAAALEAAKGAEEMVDAALRTILAPPEKTLFDGPAPSGPYGGDRP